MTDWRGRQRSLLKPRKIVGGPLAHVMLAVLAFSPAAAAAGPDEPRLDDQAPLQSPSTSASAEGQWSIVPSPNTSPTQNNELYGVTCRSASDCWAVGSYFDGRYRTLIERWDGASWTIIPSPDQGGGENHLYGVTCVSSSDCWAVGTFFGGGNQPLIERWDGISWAIVNSPDLPTSDNHLYDVTCVSESDCWAVGYALTGSSYQTLIERWDGTSWTVVPSPNSTTTEHNYLKGVTCLSASDCWAVGVYSDSILGNQTLIQHWDGISWTITPSPANLPTQTNALYTVSCASASDCWAVGYSYTARTLQTLIEHWDGSSWVIVSSPNTSPTGTNFLYSVSCVSASDCWAVGYAQGDSSLGTLVQHWDGSSWVIVSSPNTSPTRANILYGVTCLSASDCMAVGYSFNSGNFVETLTLRYAASTPPKAYPRPGITERVSVATGGAQANGPVGSQTSISADGRYVAFESVASNLVAGEASGLGGIFVHDRATGATERVSVASDGTQADGAAYQPFISGNGRFVGFHSIASNLLPGDTNGGWDTFVHDRDTGLTERVSVSSGEAQSNGTSYKATISADGRYVAFDSNASNLVPGDTNQSWDVFVRDREAGVTERVSGTGTLGGGQSSISADGLHVAFEGQASAQADSSGTSDIFVHDRVTGTIERVSDPPDGLPVNGPSNNPSISGDGRYAAFASFASNLIPGDTNGTGDIFVHDRTTGVTERISVTSDGVEGDLGVGPVEPALLFHDSAWAPSISADGRHVSFSSAFANLVPGDDNRTWDVFVHDRETRTTERVSVASDGAQGEREAWSSSVSADGRHVAFYGFASNLVPGDTNGDGDIFVRDRGPVTGIGGLSAGAEGDRITVSGWATFSGRVVGSASDPADDGAPAAGPAGAELTNASLIYRPELEDLLVRLEVTSLPAVSVGRCLQVSAASCPGANSGAGAPAVLYGMDLRAGETRYEVRALRAAATPEAPSATPYFAVYRCAPDCTEHAPLTGSLGTTGEEVLISVPLSALGATEGTALTSLRAFTAAGAATPGSLLPLDEVPLASSAIPSSRVELGIAPASTPEGQVAFTVQAVLLAGDFSGTIPTDGLSSGSYRAWARACLGDACGPATFGEVTL